jgi:lambda family phage tail tape measure protein
MDIASLGIKIDSSGVKESASDLDKLSVAAAKAEKQAANFERNFGKAAASATEAGKASKDAADKVAESIDKQVKALQDLVAVQGRSTRDAELYKLAQQGASKAQLQAADSALKMRDAFVNSREATEKAIANLKRFSIAAGVAATAAIAAGAIIAQRAIDQAGNFKDLAEQMGDTAEAIASLQPVAAKSGKSLDDVAAFSVKLTKALSKTDDESKTAGRGLAALGINFDEFKKKSPVEQLDKLAQSLQQFKDGPGKAAALEAIAKGGAQLIPFLNDLADNTQRQTRLTQEQITVLDEFGKKQAENKDKITALAQSILAQAIPTLNTLAEYLIKSATEAANAAGAADKLGTSNGIRNFAQDSAVALLAFVERCGDVVNAIGTVIRASQFLGTNLRLAAEVADLATPRGAIMGGLNGFKGVKEAYANNADAFNKLTTSFQNTIESAKKSESKKLRELFDQQNRVGDDPEVKRLAARARAAAGVKPEVDTKGLITPPGGGKKDNSAAQEAKAQLAADLDAIKNAGEAISNTYANNEKVLEAMRSAGLVDERAYYAEKKRLLDGNNVAQQDAVSQEIARLEQEKLTGKDAIDNAKKIADAQAKLLKLRENAATASQVLGIQEEAAYKKVASSLLAARQAAQDYFDTVNRGYEREISGIGKGQKARDFNGGITQIEERYQAQRRDLANQRAQAELQGSFGPEAERQYAARLAIIDEFQGKEIASYKKKYDTLDAAQQDWMSGATEALTNYYDQTQRLADQVGDALSNAFKGAEDALVDFVSTGKVDFKSLIDSMVKDIARIAIRQSITGPLANALSGAIGGGSGGGGGDILGAFISGLGARAGGGGVSAGGMYQVNEKGPELLNIGGKQLLMMGSQGGSVTPNSDISSSGAGVSVVIHQSFASDTNRKTIDQAAQSASSALRRAQRNA